MSQNKAISYDGISDTVIRKTKNFSLFLNIWTNSTIETNQLCCRARLIPRNKAYPNIPKKDQFRPITILSALYKLLEFRFLPKLQSYLLERPSKDQTGSIPSSSTQVNITINAYTAKSNKNCIFIDFKISFIIFLEQIHPQYTHSRIFTKIAFQPALHVFLNQSKILLCQWRSVRITSFSSTILYIYLEEFLDEVKIKKASLQFIYQSFQFADDIVTIIDSQNSCAYLDKLQQRSIKYNLGVNRSKSGIFLLHIIQIQKVRLYQIFKLLKITKISWYINNKSRKNKSAHRKAKQNYQIFTNQIMVDIQKHELEIKRTLVNIYLSHILYCCPAVLTQRFKAVFNQLNKFYKSSFKYICGLQKSNITFSAICVIKILKDNNKQDRNIIIKQN